MIITSLFIVAYSGHCLVRGRNDYYVVPLVKIMSSCSGTVSLPEEGIPVPFVFPSSCSASSLLLTRTIVTTPVGGIPNILVQVVDTFQQVSFSAGLTGVDPSSIRYRNAYALAIDSSTVLAQFSDMQISFVPNEDFTSVSITQVISGPCAVFIPVPGSYVFPPTPGCSGTTQSIPISFGRSGDEITVTLSTGTAVLTISESPPRITSIRVTGIVTAYPISDLSVEVYSNDPLLLPGIILTFGTGFDFSYSTTGTIIPRSSGCTLVGMTKQDYNVPDGCTTGPHIYIAVGSTESTVAVNFQITYSDDFESINLILTVDRNTSRLISESHDFGIDDVAFVAGVLPTVRMTFINVTGLTAILTFYNRFSVVSMNFFITRRLSGGITSEPITNTITSRSSECDVFFMFITGNLDEVTKDGLYIQYDVIGCRVRDPSALARIDCKYHNCGLGKYAGATSRITKDGNQGTRFQVVNLKVNKVIKGTGTVQTKAVAIRVSYVDLLSYIYFKIGMGRLLFGEIELRWALVQNYNRLYNTFLRSDYATPKAIQFFADNLYIEQYLR